MIEKIRRFYSGWPWTARLVIVVLVLFLVLIVARLALSPGIIYGAKSWLKKQGVESTIEAVDINIFDGSVALINARGEKDNQPIFNIGLVEIHWQWRPLSKKTIEVTRVALDSINVDIKQYDDAIVVSGVIVPLGESGEAENESVQVDEDVRSWAASLGEVVFTNLDICYAQHASPLAQADNSKGFIDYCASLNELRWEGSIGYATDHDLRGREDVPLSSTGDFSFSGLSITDNRLGKKLLTSKSNRLENVTISGLNKLHIDRLEMNALSLLQRNDDKHIDSVRFAQLAINKVTLSNFDSLEIDNISLGAPGIYLVRQNRTDWEYQQWIPQFPETNKADKQAGSPQQADSGSAFNISLNELNISEPDLCYLDKAGKLYYCLTFSNLGWNGSVSYATGPAANGRVNMQMRGDLELTEPVVRNQNISRDLLNLATLKMSGLKLSGMDNLSLGKLSLEKLNALQRGDKHDDNTVSFNDLTIDDVKYSPNNIAINTIDLSGLASTVSINKNGEMEYNKWLLKDGNTKKPDSQENGAAEEKKDSKAESPQPFNIALNKLRITSDREIQFADNSTQPVMNVGLNSLEFDISKLATARPDTDSPFSVSARTSRHATIELAGTIRPFAEKISLAGKGELKGLDLRVASPAVKKAVGHIIQSGQLDADLDLKAVNGELDSNIALSLYQFQMKSVSNDDAKKLDEKFGMPLNQALVLLRDKDDSIHLDIPITGDVTNPDFDPMDAIIKATTKATTVTLITFYTPFGLIYHGGNLALSLANALDFDPIKFTPGSSDLPADGKKQLDGLAKLLTEKPQVHLTMCGQSNQQDALALFPEPKTSKQGQSDKAVAEKANEKKKPLTVKQLTLLKQLAGDRQNKSKDYLVNQHGIDHSRLILCEPEHKTDEDAVAGVEVNI